MKAVTVKQASIVALLIAMIPEAVWAGKKIQRESLASYIDRMQQQTLVISPRRTGSLWTDEGRLANLASDYKAAQVGDIISILVVQDLQADNSGNVSSDRAFKASSGIDGLAGQVNTASFQELFAPHSSANLSGKAQASSKSSLRTHLSGRVMAVLPNGTLVVEAERQVTMNNEKQMVLLRGLVRPGDIGFDNSILSNQIGNLELEVKGKGVISDGTRQPNLIVRLLLRLVNF
ncbi:MAG TPA: flagellar basal body L-ring protein FlgH [Terriglobales bacterium]|jgi:flagellar L-ring protein precursor FlgH